MQEDGGDIFFVYVLPPPLTGLHPPPIFSRHSGTEHTGWRIADNMHVFATSDVHKMLMYTCMITVQQL